MLFFPGHVSKPAFDIWQHHQLKNKNQINQRLTKNIIHQNWTKKLRHSEIHLDIVFWILMFPFSLLFQRYSRSERVYFPLPHTFSKNCTFTSFTVGLLGHERRCAWTLVSLDQCSLNLPALVTVVFPEYWSTHLHVLPYMPEFNYNWYWDWCGTFSLWRN